MDAVLPWLLGIGVAIVAVAIGVISHRMEQKRREALAAWAAERGWSWRPSKRSGSPYPFDPFEQGHSRYSRYHVDGAHAEPTPGLGAAQFRVFEYHYAVTRRSGKNTRTDHYYFCCLGATAPADLGEVELRGESWGDRLAGALGFDDIDLEDPEFSKRWKLSARHKKDAYDLIGPAMQRYLASQDSSWRIRTVGPLLLVHRSGRASPEHYEAVVRLVEGLLAQLPRTLVNAARAKRGLPPVLEAGAAASSSRGRLSC